MADIEKKIEIDLSLAKTKKRLKDLIADLDVAKKERVAMHSIRERNEKIISEQKEELQIIINDISSQKLEWLHEKDAQIKALESKSQEIDAILARSDELDKKEANINKVNEEAKTARNEKASLLLEIKEAIILVEVTKREVKAEVKLLKKNSNEIDDKIISFKNKVDKLIRDNLNI